ncbi:MAG: stalk domain-containing protein [Armatimonadota bacterium]
MNNCIVRMIVVITLAAMLGACIVTSACAQARASVTVSPLTDAPSPVVLIIDSKVVTVDSLEFVRGQQVMIWLRDLETLGWGKAMPGELGEVVFKGNGVTLSFKKGEGLAKVNSLTVKLPVDTYLRNGRLMVPLSFVAKALGFDCEIAFKPVASITTSIVSKSMPSANSLQGKALYGNKGAPGITVRAIDKEYNAIEGAVAVTDADGSYTIGNLPAGEFAAYVYTGDNPSYFLRASEFAVVKDGDIARLKPIALGKILAPKKPQPGEKARSVDGSVVIEWTKCDGAASYEVTISKKGITEPIFTITSKEPKARISTDKLKSGTAYEAKVSALDAQGDFLGGTAGSGGKPWHFTFE